MHCGCCTLQRDAQEHRDFAQICYLLQMKKGCGDFLVGSNNMSEFLIENNIIIHNNQHLSFIGQNPISEN